MDLRSSHDKHFNHYKRNELEEMLIGTPMDLSFKKASTMDELAGKRPQTIRTGKAPTRTSKDRFITSSLWLSNNLLPSMKGLKDLVENVLDDPTYLCWLDLSFNAITEISDEITQFPHLKILYLHGNNITNINDVLKLRQLLNLRALTLHGNQIEALPDYRSYIIHILPQLSSLDFSPITAAEKKKPCPVGFFKMIRTNKINQ